MLAHHLCLANFDTQREKKYIFVKKPDYLPPIRCHHYKLSVIIKPAREINNHASEGIFRETFNKMLSQLLKIASR
jgi:hypothetical protein